MDNVILVEALRALIYVLLIAPGVVIMFIHSIIFFTGRSPRAADPAPATHVGGSGHGVSIVIPVKNEPEHIIVELVENLGEGLKESSLDYEIIIISDDPPDSVAGVKRRCEDLALRLGLKDFRFIVRTEGPKGRAGALNYGVLNSAYDLLLFLDADSRLERTTIPELISCVESGYDACVGRWAGYTYRNTKLGLALLLSMKYVVDTLYRGRFNAGLMIFPLGTGTIYRKDALLKAGLWEPDVIQDDMYMGAKLHSMGYTIGFTEKAVVRVSVPSSLKAFIVQQCRWSYGAIETLRKGYVRHTLRRVAVKDLLKAVEGLVFFLQYLPLAGLALSLLLIPALSLILRDDIMNLNPYPLVIFGLTLFAYGLSIYKSIRELSLPRIRILRSMGSIAAFSTSISPYILHHSLKALLNNKIVYVVTPKGSREYNIGGPSGMVLFSAYLTFMVVANLLLSNYYTSLWLLTFIVATAYTLLNAEKAPTLTP
ncbi:MAG: glycosyltransferase family 2 protein [Zestosphaera sp.]